MSMSSFKKNYMCARALVYVWWQTSSVNAIVIIFNLKLLNQCSLLEALDSLYASEISFLQCNRILPQIMADMQEFKILHSVDSPNFLISLQGHTKFVLFF